MDESQAAQIIASYVANRFTSKDSPYNFDRVRVWVHTMEPNEQYPELHWWVGVCPLENEAHTEGYIVFEDEMYCSAAEVPSRLNAYVTEHIEPTRVPAISWNVN